MEMCIQIVYVYFAYVVGDGQNEFWKYPELFLSNDKWSFLNNGALLCRVVTYRKMPVVITQVFLK